MFHTDGDSSNYVSQQFSSVHERRLADHFVDVAVVSAKDQLKWYYQRQDPWTHLDFGI